VLEQVRQEPELSGQVQSLRAAQVLPVRPELEPYQLQQAASELSGSYRCHCD